MEKSKFKQYIDSMIPDLIEEIRKEADRLYDSGGIDTSIYEDSYRLPKTILCVAIEKQIIQYTPLTKTDKDRVKNLKNF